MSLCFCAQGGLGNALQGARAVWVGGRMWPMRKSPAQLRCGWWGLRLLSCKGRASPSWYNTSQLVFAHPMHFTRYKNNFNNIACGGFLKKQTLLFIFTCDLGSSPKRFSLGAFLCMFEWGKGVRVRSWIDSNTLGHSWFLRSFQRNWKREDLKKGWKSASFPTPLIYIFLIKKQQNTAQNLTR